MKKSRIIAVKSGATILMATALALGSLSAPAQAAKPSDDTRIIAKKSDTRIIAKSGERIIAKGGLQTMRDSGWNGV